MICLSWYFRFCIRILGLLNSMKYTLISILFVLGTFSAVLGQQEVPLTVYEVGDTLYRAEDHLPSNPRLVHANLQDYWDFTGLMAPYVQEIYINAGEGVNDLDEMYKPVSFAYNEGLKYTVVVNQGNMWISGIQMRHDNYSMDGKCEPYIPLRVNTSVVGDESEYFGSIIFNLDTEIVAAQEDFELSLADSIRIVVDWNYHVVSDKKGQMQMEGGLYDVIRQKLKKTVNAQTEIKNAGMWSVTNKQTSVDLPTSLKSGTTFSFWSSEVADPLAVVETDETESAVNVSFRVHKQSGRRIVQSTPSQPDIYVYPNPSFGIVRFDLVNIPVGEYQLEIYNILGVRLRSYSMDVDGPMSYPLDLSDLKKGTYIYRLVDTYQKTLRSKRLVIITP